LWRAVERHRPPGLDRLSAFRSPLRGPWLTAMFGSILLVTLPIVIITGLLDWPTRWSETVLYSPRKQPSKPPGQSSILCSNSTTPLTSTHRPVGDHHKPTPSSHRTAAARPRRRPDPPLTARQRPRLPSFQHPISPAPLPANHGVPQSAVTGRPPGFGTTSALAHLCGQLPGDGIRLWACGYPSPT
jgi:hypothetical protein